MPLTVAVQMDPLETINIAGDSTFAIMLAGQARGHRLFHYAAGDLSYRDGRLTAPARPVTVQRAVGGHHRYGDWQVHRSRRRGGRGADAAGSAVRSGLHHRHPPAGTDPGRDAGGQRSGRGAQRARKAVRARLCAVHAADAHHPPAGGGARLPRDAWRGGGEAALRQCRIGGVPCRPQRRQPGGADRAVRPGVARAVHGAGLPPGRGEGRQAHRADRRKARGRDQPPAQEWRDPLKPGRRRQRAGDPIDRAGAADLRANWGPSSPGAGCCSSAST